MGTNKTIFAVDHAVDRTIAHDRKSSDRKWRDRKWRQSLSGSVFCACTTGNCAISALVWPFDRKWQSHVTGRGTVRKWPCQEVALTGSRFCACPTFPRIFFLVVVTWLPDVTECHLTPFGVPLDVRMPKRKLRNTRSDRRSCDPLEVFLGCSLRRPRPNGSDVTSVTGIGSMFCTCATGSVAFWPEVTKSHDRKYVLPIPGFSPRFFLSSSNMATLGSCAIPVMTEGHVTPSEVSLECSLRRPRPITIGKPRVLYLSWLLEVSLVICPFYFRIVSI